MKTFNVCYSVCVLSEVKIKAKTRAEAKKQAKEILGADIVVDDAWELNLRSRRKHPNA